MGFRCNQKLRRGVAVSNQNTLLLHGRKVTFNSAFNYRATDIISDTSPTFTPIYSSMISSAVLYWTSFINGCRLTQFVETTFAYRDGGFILCQVPPSDHYNHYPHNGYVAFWQGGVLWFLNFDYSIWPNLLLRFENCFGFVSLSNHQVLYLEGHLEGHLE